MTTTTEYFGGCPECGQNDGYLNIERDHWFFRDAHKTTWRPGSNLFSSWRHESEADWRRNGGHLEGYDIVDPIDPEPTEEERRSMEEYEARLAEEKRIDRGYGVKVGPGNTMRALGPDDVPFDLDLRPQPSNNTMIIDLRTGEQYPGAPTRP